MEWTERAVRTLQTLWLEGVPAREIGQRLGGISRNAVIGKAHRLGLSKQSDANQAEVTPAFVGTGDLTERMCRWPIGHPGDPDFRFCGEAKIAGRPYCAEHCSLAYRGKSDEAA
ncbi:MAG: hypothetical protein CFH37_00847 [Alphaproteobacteria bacterium MarineAlpha9_Bin7]|nr:MAG: hypothetical protein CFH37_00847 [Alphaproteobacteria bacterium MarineAlpha9_Bin7]